MQIVIIFHTLIIRIIDKEKYQIISYPFKDMLKTINVIIISCSDYNFSRKYERRHRERQRPRVKELPFISAYHVTTND